MFNFLTMAEGVFNMDDGTLFMIILGVIGMVIIIPDLKGSLRIYRNPKPLEKYDFGCKTPEELDAYKRQLEKEWKEKCRKNGRK